MEDLEVDATPEDLMLSYVSGEKGKVISIFPASVIYMLVCEPACTAACDFATLTAVAQEHGDYTTAGCEVLWAGALLHCECMSFNL